eukprot:scaffold138473_cov130-Phaeocystis_antarctica.AAC.1
MDDGAAAMPRVSANSLKMSAGSALTARAISLSTSPSATCPANSGTSGRKAEPTMPREVASAAIFSTPSETAAK